ncbi:MAG: hypothetical protein LBP78_02215 [Acidaminococcales bacterium]|jgi:hypothetical protein|nr:hypothetical protein [Acidaminococcales bacterium]
MFGKTFSIALFCIILAGPRALAMTYANEPKDFYGLKWGLAVSELEKSGQRFVPAGAGSDRRISSYNCAARSDNFYGTSFDKVIYDFFNGRFFMVRAIKSGNSALNSQELYSSLVKAHGRPTQQNDNVHQKTVVYLWQGNDTFISLRCDFARKQTVLSFYSHPLYQQWSAQGGPRPSGRIRERAG